MIEEVSERCSCGAHFKAKSERAVELLTKWRKQHQCPAEILDREAAMDMHSNLVEDKTYPEMRIGFRGNEWDE
jgi:hypothetical protein